jgi:hypothetical protein
MLVAVIIGIAGLILSGCGSLANRKWGFIDTTGNLVIPYQFDEVATDNYTGFAPPGYNFFLLKPFRNFSEGLCAIRIGASWGYIDKAGKVVIPLQYDSAGTFSEGLACVRKGDKIGYIDKAGKVVIPITLDWFPQLSSNHASAEDNDEDSDHENDQKGLQKNESVPFMIECCQFSEGLAAVHRGQKCGYIDRSGNFVIPPRYEMCSQFYEGMATVSDGTTLCRIDKSGRVIAKLTSTDFYGDGLFVREVGHNQYDFVDRATQKPFSQVFGGAHQFSAGLAAVSPDSPSSMKGRQAWGYIDKTGKMVIPPRFYMGSNDLSSAFVDDRAIAATSPLGNGPFGVIDRTGKWIVSPHYYLIAAYREGLAWALSNSKIVYLDKNGREVIDPHTSWGNSFSEGLAAVR